jgi:hypothetical protein
MTKVIDYTHMLGLWTKQLKTLERTNADPKLIDNAKNAQRLYRMLSRGKSLKKT